MRFHPKRLSRIFYHCNTLRFTKYRRIPIASRLGGVTVASSSAKSGYTFSNRFFQICSQNDWFILIQKVPGRCSNTHPAITAPLD